jgi:5-methylcytosine-specific restriction endonuclease McrA
MDTARALTENLAALLRREHDALAEFLVALAAFDRDRVWVQLGYPSLFDFLHRELRLSRSAAHYRKVAAQLIQQVPAVVEPLRQGRLCMTSVVEAARVVTAENCETVLPQFFGLSRREAMEVVAALQPHPAPPTRTVVTSFRAASHTTAAREAAGAPSLPCAPAGEVTSRPDDSPGELARREGPPAFAPLPPPLEVVPLSAEKRRVHITLSKSFLDKLAAATDALSQARPGATPEEVLEAGLDLVLAQASKRRALVEKPRKSRAPSKSDRIPAEVRRAVWSRDGGGCQWPIESGGVCGCTRHVEYDHVQPIALGGTSTMENVRLLCKRHNLLAARLALGDRCMDRYTRDPRKQPQEPRPLPTAAPREPAPP